MPHAAALLLGLLVLPAVACGSKDSGASSSASAAASARSTASATGSSNAPSSSPFERFADAICACKDEKCASDALDAFEAAAKKDRRAPGSETPAESAALERATRCMDKLAPQGDGK
ncbi:MAG: hypothetical protein U0414_16565 [Polyangiaceae bacterium]